MVTRCRGTTRKASGERCAWVGAAWSLPPVVGDEAVAGSHWGKSVAGLVVGTTPDSKGRGERAVVTDVAAGGRCRWCAARVDALSATYNSRRFRFRRWRHQVRFDPRQNMLALRVGIETAVDPLVAQLDLMRVGGQRNVDLDGGSDAAEVEPARRRPDEACRVAPPSCRTRTSSSGVPLLQQST